MGGLADMSNYYCEHCGAICADSPRGYVTGCIHYPPDTKSTNMEATILSLATDNIKKFEGCKLKAYLDSVGVWTLGWGHTKGVKAGDTCTQAQADKWLNEETRVFHDGVLRLTSGTKSTKRQHAAMICLAYNIGLAGFSTSTVLRRHRAARYTEAADAFLMWNKGTVDGRKVVLKGLSNRRADERALYLMV